MKKTDLYVIYFPYDNEIGEDVYTDKTLADLDCVKEVEMFKKRILPCTIKKPVNEYYYPKVKTLYDAIDEFGEMSREKGADERESNYYNS